MLSRNLYTWSGFSLLVTGVLISLTSHFILLVTWLTALGIAMLILSLIFLVLGRTIPKISPEVSDLFLQTGVENIASLVEELGIKSKAVYLPASLTHNGPRALIPLRPNPSLPAITKPLPQRLIVRYGPHSDDVGLLVATAGTTAAAMLESTPGPTLIGLESTLSSLFRGILGVADGVKVVHREDYINIEINNPRLEQRVSWFHQCLGSPLASIAASIAAEVWDSPVVIKQEEYHKKSWSIEIKVLK